MEIADVYSRTVVGHGGGFPGASTHLSIYGARFALHRGRSRQPGPAGVRAERPLGNFTAQQNTQLRVRYKPVISRAYRKKG